MTNLLQISSITMGLLTAGLLVFHMKRGNIGWAIVMALSVALNVNTFINTLR